MLNCWLVVLSAVCLRQNNKPSPWSFELLWLLPALRHWEHPLHPLSSSFFVSLTGWRWTYLPPQHQHESPWQIISIYYMINASHILSELINQILFNKYSVFLPFSDMVYPCSPGYPRPPSVDQALNSEIYLPASVPRLLGLKARVTTPS